MQEGKVIPIRKAIFSENQRAMLSEKITNHTEKPDEVVSLIESELCRQLVIAVREVAAALGDRIGKWLGQNILK